jgi:hypothetical protein
MKKGARPKRRLRLYLRCIGIEPTVPGVPIQSQYAALEPEQRKLARSTGRRLVREAGSVANAVAAMDHLGAQQTTLGSAPPAAAPSRARSRKEIFEQFRRRWSPLTPPCPSCRMANGFPKRSWPGREWADEVWAKQHDRDRLRVYACPVQPGFWHLGHIAYAIASVVLEEAFIPSCCPAVACETAESA